MSKEEIAAQKKLYQFFDTIFLEYHCLFKRNSHIKFFEIDRIEKKIQRNFLKRSVNSITTADKTNVLSTSLYPILLTSNFQDLLKSKSVFDFLQLYKEKRALFAIDSSIDTSPFVPDVLKRNVFGVDCLDDCNNESLFVVMDAALRRALVGLVDLIILFSLKSTQKKNLRFISDSSYVALSENAKMAEQLLKQDLFKDKKNTRTTQHSGKDDKQVRAISLFKDNATLFTALTTNLEESLLYEPYLVFLENFIPYISLNFSPFTLSELLLKAKEEQSMTRANMRIKRFILISKATSPEILRTASDRDVLAKFIHEKKMSSKGDWFDDSHIRKLLSETI